MALSFPAVGALRGCCELFALGGAVTPPGPEQPPLPDPRLAPGADRVLQPFPQPGCSLPLRAGSICQRRVFWTTGDIPAVPGVPFACPSPPFPRRCSAGFLPWAPVPKRGAEPRSGTSVQVLAQLRLLPRLLSSTEPPKAPRAPKAPSPAREPLPAGWQCYPASQARYSASGKGGIESVPNVRPFFSFAAVPMGVGQCKKFGAEFAGIYLCFLELRPGLRLF